MLDKKTWDVSSYSSKFYLLTKKIVYFQRLYCIDNCLAAATVERDLNGKFTKGLAF